MKARSREGHPPSRRETADEAPPPSRTDGGEEAMLASSLASFPRNLFAPSSILPSPKTSLCPQFDPARDVPFCPAYFPTAQEYADPIGFINRIRPEAERFGACKIIPPPSWYTACAASRSSTTIPFPFLSFCLRVRFFRVGVLRRKKKNMCLVFLRSGAPHRRSRFPTFSLDPDKVVFATKVQVRLFSLPFSFISTPIAKSGIPTLEGRMNGKFEASGCSERRSEIAVGASV